MGSATFNFTGGWQHWNVPDGVNTVIVTLTGGGSGGKQAGRVAGRISVKKNDVLWLLVGEHGKVNSGNSGGDGGFGGGGHGGGGVNAQGGDGGGGCSAIRKNGTGGTVVCVAAGAGGQSGDGGDGGAGGTDTGESGHRGTAGGGATGQSTGGTQNQGGNGGTSSSGSRLFGGNASNAVLGQAGRGGGTNTLDGPGGGGGGGGYHAGGGGAAGSTGWAPGIGGGGGSNFIGGLTSITNVRGSGGTGNGQISLDWSDPAPSKARPSNPSLSQPADGARLGDYNVTFKATLNDTGGGQVRMKIVTTSNNWKTSSVHYSDWVASGKVATYKLTGLQPNIHQIAHVWAQDAQGQLSLGYASTNYYSNASPHAPNLVAPANGASVTGLSSTVFDWTPNDPDGQPQGGAELRYFRDFDDAPVHTRTVDGPSSTYTENPLTFKPNSFYLWQVRTHDPRGLWGPWSDTRRLFVIGVQTPPRPKSPVNREAVDVGTDTRFDWQFRDPEQGDDQTKADIRWRVNGQDDNAWITRFGNGSTPGAQRFWNIGPGTFGIGLLYEWQVRTYDTLSGGVIPSDWSDSEFFHAVPTPGLSSGITLVEGDAFEGALGCGVNTAYLAVKGGHRLLGSLTPASQISYGYIRDDMSTCTVQLPISSESGGVCQLASIARSWQHEIVVYRDNGHTKERVWEGPVTRITYKQNLVEIEAHDVMAWVYRRIMKQGYNDTYPHTRSVVDRAAHLIMNALAPDDPNILKYLTLFMYDDDAKQSRVRTDWQSTAWEEVDDLAATAGMDYVTVGRRIIINDTHRPIGRLPLLRSKDFSDAPVITEYGMLMATEYGVTNNAGVWGSATRDDSFTGPVELLTSAYGSTAAAPATTLTRDAQRKLIETLNDQAKRGIASRWPTPVQVRVPDNSSLQPSCPIPFRYLIPGVWLPVQADHVCRKISQWQKLDQVSVIDNPADGEKVQVVLSPAPNAGEDPDAAAAAEAALSGN